MLNILYCIIPSFFLKGTIKLEVKLYTDFYSFFEFIYQTISTISVNLHNINIHKLTVTKHNSGFTVKTKVLSTQLRLAVSINVYSVIQRDSTQSLGTILDCCNLQPNNGY